MNIFNAATRPINQTQGSVPDVSGAIQSYYQEMVFTKMTKKVVNFQTVEVPLRINFRGTIQPFSDQQLKMLPEGQRTQWQYFNVIAGLGLNLNPDDVIMYNDVQYRVFARRDYSLYGYLHLIIITDWVTS